MMGASLMQPGSFRWDDVALLMACQRAGTLSAAARTMALDRQTHKAYVVTAKFGPPPAATAEQPHPRPSILPGTFEVIVVGKP